MTDAEAINLLTHSKSLAQTLYRDSSYTMTMTDLIKLYGVEQVINAGYTKRDEILEAAGLRRFDLAILLGALVLCTPRPHQTRPLVHLPPAFQRN